jgi:arsenite transporter
MLNKIPRVLQKYMVLAIPVVMGLGFIVGLLGDMRSLRILVMPFTFLMIYPSMVCLNFKQILARGDGRLQVVTQAMNFLFMPALTYGVGLLFFPDEPLLRLGLFLTGLLPTSGMTLSWTHMANGNLPSAVKMTVIGLLAGSLLTPFYMQFAFGTAIHLPLSRTLIQIGLVVFLPMALGYVTQLYLLSRYGQKAFAETYKPMIGPWGTIGVLGVQFVAMAMKAPDLAARPQLLLALGVPILLVYIVNFSLSTYLARFFSRRADGVAFIYGSALRNLSVALAIAMTVFPEQGTEVALLISLGFIFQSQLAAWHVKFLPRFLPEK